MDGKHIDRYRPSPNVDKDRDRPSRHIDRYNESRRAKGQPLIDSPDEQAGSSQGSSDEMLVERNVNDYIEVKRGRSRRVPSKLFHRSATTVFDDDGVIDTVYIRDKDLVVIPNLRITYKILSISKDLAVAELEEETGKKIRTVVLTMMKVKGWWPIVQEAQGRWLEYE